MSKIHDFAIERGQIKVQSKPSVAAVSPLHEKLWAMVTDPSLPLDEWTIVYNVMGPILAQVIAEAHPSHCNQVIRNYLQVVGVGAEELTYFHALSDVPSKISHILRERFEVMLRVARETKSRETALELSGLSEVKSHLNHVPSYVISAAVESLSLFRAKR